MRAGTLRHAVTIQAKTESQSTSGFPSEVWDTHANVRARVSPTGGRENWQGEIPDAGRMYDIEIRYLSTVTVNMRVLFDSRYFYIKEIINPDERGIRMIMKAEESLD